MSSGFPRKWRSRERKKHLIKNKLKQNSCDCVQAMTIDKSVILSGETISLASDINWSLRYSNLSGDVIITLNRLFEEICTRCRLNKLTAFWKVWSNDYETWSVCGPTVACELCGYIKLTMQSRTKQTNSESSAGERHVSHSTVPIMC